MKKSIFVTCMILLFSLLLSGCGNSESPAETTAAHTHQWQDIPGEHARICIECNEKQLKPEAHSFVSVGCEQPKECEICHAMSDEPPEGHDWSDPTIQDDCWSTTEIKICSKCHTDHWIHADLALPNHIWKEETADGKTTYTCTRCREAFTIASETAKFSYAEVLKEYKIGDPGVKHENFFLEWESGIEGAIDAVIKAKCEISIQQNEYDTIAVSYDQDADIWCVCFYTANTPGGDQSVYLNGNGMTCYIVCSE